eukprot:CAMPEP_0119006206 /NCGR_PEP_ID=MMETSP1176-20130426/2169_1 /TAXON_ID=265551 /ORGANISM="Synedropsis recta cf, Strain CCMP1620" /LENGTH=261 /DNA_ID=CAMNT_0006958097 /DNA_START=66 /DNA_END=851 /DNA_ORIENTATION=+
MPNGTPFYWGEMDTTTTFCEPKYAFSSYFAEFVNAWSSLIYVVVGIYIVHKFPHSRWNRMAGIWLATIGIGSFLFHATMRYSMQLMDELPMVGFIWTVVMHKTMSTQHASIQKYATAIQVFISMQAVALVALYIYWDQYEIFLHGFTIMVLNDAVLGFLLKTTGPLRHGVLKRQVNMYGLCLILVGKGVWELENQVCHAIPSLIWPMHTIWHFCSAASAYNTCIFNHLCCLDDSSSDDVSSKIPVLFGWPSARTVEKKKKV